MKHNDSGRLLADYVCQLLPPIIWRCRWNEYSKEFGLPFSRGHMQNLDSKKRGPKSAMLGGKVFYRKEDLLAWIAKEEWNNDEK